MRLREDFFNDPRVGPSLSAFAREAGRQPVAPSLKSSVLMQSCFYYGGRVAHGCLHCTGPSAAGSGATDYGASASARALAEYACCGLLGEV
jgi:hypothetical protein